MVFSVLKTIKHKKRENIKVERKKLISIPLWVIMLFVVMAISVGVLINGLFFAEPVVTDKETNYVDDKYSI